MDTKEYLNQAGPILEKAKRIAKEYYNTTGRILGVTGEIGEYEVVKNLRIEICKVRTAGFDAIQCINKIEFKIQIKTRRQIKGSNNSQRMPAISLKNEWDKIFLAILNEDYNLESIFEAARVNIENELKKPGSEARKRGQLSISKFIQIGRKIWPLPRTL